MMKTSFFKYLFALFLFTKIFYSCIKKIKYTTTPSIEYKNFIPYTNESADLQILFNDGDGDIGLGNTDSTLSFFSTYYYLDTITKKYRAFFNPLLNDTLRSNYIVKAPSEIYKAYNGKAISGEISVNLQQYRHSKKIKKIKYVIYLVDKAGNKSNVTTTPEIVVP